MTTDASEVPTPSPVETPGRPQRRRRVRPPRVEVPADCGNTSNAYLSGCESETTNGNLTDSGEECCGDLKDGSPAGCTSPMTPTQLLHARNKFESRTCQSIRQRRHVFTGPVEFLLRFHPIRAADGRARVDGGADAATPEAAGESGGTAHESARNRRDAATRGRERDGAARATGRSGSGLDEAEAGWDEFMWEGHSACAFAVIHVVCCSGLRQGSYLECSSEQIFGLTGTFNFWKTVNVVRDCM